MRLAPLYDLASILPYDQFDQHKVKLAMKIGGEYHLNHIGPRQWQKFAHEIRFDSDQLITNIRDMAAQMPDVLAEVSNTAAAEGLDKKIIDRLAVRITERVQKSGKLLRL